MFSLWRWCTFIQVHFSVGDKDREDDDRKREQAETNTTINLKSWRWVAGQVSPSKWCSCDIKSLRKISWTQPSVMDYVTLLKRVSVRCGFRNLYIFAIPVALMRWKSNSLSLWIRQHNVVGFVNPVMLYYLVKRSSEITHLCRVELVKVVKKDYHTITTKMRESRSGQFKRQWILYIGSEGIIFGYLSVNIRSNHSNIRGGEIAITRIIQISTVKEISVIRIIHLSEVLSKHSFLRGRWIVSKDNSSWFFFDRGDVKSSRHTWILPLGHISFFRWILWWGLMDSFDWLRMFCCSQNACDKRHSNRSESLCFTSQKKTPKNY